MENGLIRSSDGNISIRLDENRFLITPSGLYKRRIKRKQILVVNRKGELIHQGGGQRARGRDQSGNDQPADRARRQAALRALDGRPMNLGTRRVYSE